LDFAESEVDRAFQSTEEFAIDFFFLLLKPFQERLVPPSYRCLSVPTVDGRGNFQIFFLLAFEKGIQMVHRTDQNFGPGIPERLCD
jgi:hypothetical protein